MAGSLTPSAVEEAIVGADSLAQRAAEEREVVLETGLKDAVVEASQEAPRWKRPRWRTGTLRRQVLGASVARGVSDEAEAAADEEEEEAGAKKGCTAAEVVDEQQPAPKTHGRVQEQALLAYPSPHSCHTPLRAAGALPRTSEGRTFLLLGTSAAKDFQPPRARPVSGLLLGALGSPALEEGAMVAAKVASPSSSSPACVARQFRAPRPRGGSAAEASPASAATKPRQAEPPPASEAKRRRLGCRVSLS